MSLPVFVLGRDSLTTGAVRLISYRQADLHLCDDEAFRRTIDQGAAVLAEKWRNQEVVYGVTTGVGESCTRGIPKELVPQFSVNLSRFHGCGLGSIFDEHTARAVVAVRLASLVKGWSGVRWSMLNHLCTLLGHDILPRIPAEGSVGASGDLTPLSYVVAAMIGEREVTFRGEIMPARAALDAVGIDPIALQPKEGLALMNGTSVMSALCALAIERAEYLSMLATRVTALVSAALLGNKSHFDDRIFAAKPHAGQRRAAQAIAEDLQLDDAYRRSAAERVQDTYALRCAPHVIGVVLDALPWMKDWMETEINSVNDNPLIDPGTGDVLHGGNFYGGHAAFVADSLKTAVANLADLADRQMALLLNVHRNHGLPLNLSGAPQDALPVNHAFKALQIACSAWAAEALKGTMPASVFSRSTESHNQDKVSMGTIAARDCLRVIELTEQVLVATALAGVQALELREKNLNQPQQVGTGIRQLANAMRAYSPFVAQDRPLDQELRGLLAALRQRKFPLSRPDHA
ncbi:HAL/PAL/TAL family ammonia-lyase [Acanthopleuribacter pedis]|uniref:Aromatic amino acid lyase n=1 Tax=Acanthopleuribacter pedis TaxID=442870 RepID=A0A8J7Q665_9BACT|nr:aromatic amino acid ammonia-lyase [Acanthopleuribacter pedis]MBO1318882.1 aromatic amino acid lyase [Acanthopleuribacter pedis]